MTDDPEVHAQQQAKQQAILDSFLAIAPSLGPIRLADSTNLAEETEPEPIDAAETSLPQDPAATERLATALLALGKRKEAARLLLKLSMEMPEKSVYFADLLDNRSADPLFF